VASVTTPIILATQEAEIRRIMVQSQPGQTAHETPFQKHSTQNRASRVAQEVEHLPIKYEAPSSSPSTTKKRRKKKEI
jgi:hypothetical protein